MGKEFAAHWESFNGSFGKVNGGELGGKGEAKEIGNKCLVNT